MPPQSGDDQTRARSREAEPASVSDSVIRAFEQARARGETPAIRDYLRGGEDEQALLIELVHVDLELRLKGDEPARVEAYLAEFPRLATEPAEVLELIVAEYQLRRRQGEAVNVEEYTARFPAHSADLLMRLGETIVSGKGRRTLVASGWPAVPGYELIEELGRGGMGIVFKARDLQLDRPVALKFLPEEYARDGERLARFLREARTASALNHPNICTVHALGDREGRPFLVMELIEGETLGAMIGRGPDLAALAQIVAQAARALGAAHAAGVVHRDVKPDNLMVRADGLVKVLDFGLARRLPTLGATASNDTAPGEFLGTAAYASPEQALGQPAESASDIFSLGIVLYQLATERHPFEADSALGFLHAIAYDPVPPANRLRPELGAPLAALLEAMLQKPPQLRPTAAEVERVLRGLGAKAPGPEKSPTFPATRPTVGRQVEGAALRAAWLDAESGRGALLCVCGEPGIGKTTLVEGFLRELREEGRPYLIARGRCSERLAGAEAYLPVLEALESLLAGEDGPSVARVMKAVAPTWYTYAAPALSSTPPPPAALAGSQLALKRELAALVREASRLAPVVLFLEDIHWADLSTVDLLAHLGRAAPAARLLVLVTYRPTELLLGPHPFLSVKWDLQAAGACRELSLGLLARNEIASYLDQVFPGHDFPPDFADAVHARTDGGPLFMADLLAYLRDRGVIAEQGGRWALARPLPELWPELPESARALIQRKFDHLDDADRRLLTAAAVQGPAFDAVAVAAATGREVAETEERLRDLERVHALVRQEREYELPDRTPTLRYRFVHVLYQQALYREVTPARRTALSVALARALDGHRAGEGAMAAELAGLYEAGRDFVRAAEGWHRAARAAGSVFAHQEAVVLARRGLRLVDSLPSSKERDGLELGLRVVLGMQLQVTRGFAAPEAYEVYRGARGLSDGVGPTEFQVLWGTWLYHKVRSELARAAELAEGLRELAEQLGDLALALQAQQALAVTTLCQGHPEATLRHMEQAALLYDPVRHRGHSFQFGQDPAVACKAFGAVALWLTGRPDEAARLSAEAVRQGRELGQPSTLALALLFGAMVHHLRRDGRRALECALACQHIAAEHGLSFWQAGATVMKGWAQAACGQVDEGADSLERGLRDWNATGSVTYLTYFLGLQAEVLERRGQREQAQQTLRDALELAIATGEGMYAAELHRLDGELAPSIDDASRHYQLALQVARERGATGPELRAAISLARLSPKGEGQSALAAIRSRFREGLDTADLREADALLTRTV